MDAAMRDNWERWNKQVGGVGSNGKSTPWCFLEEYSPLSRGTIYYLDHIDVLKGNTSGDYEVIGRVDMRNVTEADLPSRKKRKAALKVCPHCGKSLK